MKGWHPLSRALALAFIASMAVLVHGYHLGTDDAAIYVPAIKRVADPALFPFNSHFFMDHASLSLFPDLIGNSARVTRIPVDWAIFVWHAASIYLLLMAGHRLVSVCFQSAGARWAGVVLLACVLTVPVAGTALVIMDPYVTARSLSTPLTLFAVASFAANRGTTGLVWLALAALIHPQMSAYGFVFLGCFALEGGRPWSLLAIPSAFEFRPASGGVP